MSNSWSTSNNDVVVGVVGVTGSGKSSFIKRVTQCADILVGEGLESMTQDIAQYKIQHKGVLYTLVDTPGFDDSVREDEDVFHELAEWMEKSYRAGQRLNGLIYLHPIISSRERGSEIRNLRMFKKVCGGNNFSNVILGLTFCDQEERAVIARRQKQLVETPEWWGDMIAKGSRVEHLSLEPDACLELLSRFAPTSTSGAHNQKMTLQIQSEIVEQGVSVDDTEAAQVVVHKHELEAIRERERRELSQLHIDFEARMNAASIKYRQQMEIMMQKQASIRRRQQDFENTLKLQDQLREELERKARLALQEERSKEEAQANEMKQLEELLQKTRIANQQVERRIRTQNEWVSLRPRLVKRWKTFQLEWALLQDWEKLGRYKQNHMTWVKTDGSGADPSSEFMGAFCDGCLKSYRSSEQYHRTFSHAVS
ncbi:P-loop containing nucleoside triphosphate hydrolase protein [Lophiotrema nucula]|uniref:P-loop containing nucleoside triphosphate hydrolase protein n=1 Tax=Lophiotrema nucula TaxID=690887 RepID=A0A6A5YKQ4_9PLEO|nr:P-loop containing nucleoside triphosphate hydrolase protein [Lophiotrema nucula]